MSIRPSRLCEYRLLCGIIAHRLSSQARIFIIATFPKTQISTAYVTKPLKQAVSDFSMLGDNSSQLQIQWFIDNTVLQNS